MRISGVYRRAFLFILKEMVGVEWTTFLGQSIQNCNLFYII